ncbi:MAG: type III secretion protein [Spirochaetaceae bacterium]|nr:MAG: type III secretion protein [Spirochaetaceae bacterium]
MKRQQSAVALRYDRRLPAPLLVAKGRGELAGRLIRIAEDHDVPIVNRQRLADDLYFVEAGDFIPEPFYEAVAEILAFVWRVSGGERRDDDTERKGKKGVS